MRVNTTKNRCHEAHTDRTGVEAASNRSAKSRLKYLWQSIHLGVASRETRVSTEGLNSLPMIRSVMYNTNNTQCQQRLVYKQTLRRAATPTQVAIY